MDLTDTWFWKWKVRRFIEEWGAVILFTLVLVTFGLSSIISLSRLAMATYKQLKKPCPCKETRLRRESNNEQSE